MAESQQTFTFSVPLDLSRAAREDVAEMVIEFIVERTQRGRDKNNRPFAGYSDSYKASKDFAIAGKSNAVDLTFTGDMLTDIQILETSVTGFITIGFEPNTAENDRAAWNRNNLRPTTPKRDFLGITQKDLDRIIRVYRAKTPEEREVDTAVRSQAAAIINALGNLFNG